MKKLLALLTVLHMFSCSDSFAAAGLTLWVHPYLPATELTRRFTPLTEYLSEKLGRPVTIRLHQSYQSHLDFVGADRADLAFVGPVAYVRIRDQYGPKPLLARVEAQGEPFFHGVIFTRSRSEIKTLADLKGKTFAFGDPNSTMSHVVPRAMLAQAGTPVSQLASHDYLQAHHDVALAVLGGYFDAGAVKEEVYQEFESKGLKILARSPPIPDHLFVARSTLPEELLTELRSHLLAVTLDPRGRKILSSIRETATNLLPAADQDYDALRELMKSCDQ